MVETKVNTIFWMFPKVTRDEVSQNPLTQFMMTSFSIIKIIYLIGSWYHIHAQL